VQHHGPARLLTGRERALNLTAMQIIRQQLLTGAAAADDTAVVIDVFRAFTCSSLLLHFGVERLLLEEDPARALELKKSRGFIALGEIDGVMVEGFDFGNSPSQIAAAGEGIFRGRTVVQRTSAGVRGVFAAEKNCRTVYTAGYTTAAALAAVLLRDRPRRVHLVAMGLNGVSPSPEDENCAAYLQHLLDPRSPYDHLAALKEILTHESALKFLRGDRPQFPPADVTYCLQRDLFPSAMKVFDTPDGFELRAVPAESPA
jgi:2-phosphosulfolactate phosphatase